MRGGDLSNQVTPRLLFLWEGCVAENVKRRVYESPERHLRRMAPRLNVVRRMWDVAWRFDYRVDVFSLLGENYGAPLEKVIDRLDLPVSHVTAYDSFTQAAKLMAYAPAVARIFVGEEYSPIAFGGKTVVVPSEGDWEPLL